jgi:hypothetical protein
MVGSAHPTIVMAIAVTVDKEQGLNGFCDFLLSRSNSGYSQLDGER